MFAEFPLKKFLTFFVLFILSCRLNAQNQLLFEHISTANGLSSSIVHQTLTDKFGFLWIATRDGLNKYDGYNITVFRAQENHKKSLLSNDIATICEYNGKIWAGTWGGGISQFDGNKYFTNYINDRNDPQSLTGNFIQWLFKDSQNKLWICTTTGLDRFDEKDKKFKHYLPNRHILCIAEDQSGTLFAGTYQYLYTLNKNRNDQDSFFLPALNVTEVFIDHSNQVWIGTDKGLFQLNQTTRKIIPFKWEKYINYFTENIYVKSMFEDSDRNIWIATQKDGIFKLLRKEKKIINLSNDPANPLRISYDNIYHFNEDNSKNLWVSTPGGGLNKLDLKPQKFKYYTHTFNNPKSLNHKSVQVFYEDEAGNFWIGTSFGLNKFNRSTDEFENIKLPLPRNFPSKISIMGISKSPQGNLWIGTNRFSWMGYDYKHNKIITGRDYFKIPDLRYSDRVTDLLLDSHHNMWIGTWGGLFMYSFRNKTTSVYAKEYNQLIANNVTDLYEDMDGIIWVGTSDGGLTRLNPVNNKTIQFQSAFNDVYTLSSPHILSIQETKEYLWVGTTSGLNRIDKKNFTIKRYTEKDGLVNQDIAKMQVDNEGNLWLANNRGLTKFDPVNETFTNYTKYDGLPNIEFTWLSSYKARDGELFFGGTEGFISFYPDRIKGNITIPPIVLTNFKVFNEVKDLPGNISELKKIVLEYNENRISFEFASLDYTASQSNRFKYRLIGFDRYWINAEDKRYANYTNLDPGKYTFQVIGSNNDGVWNTKGASIDLIIVPPVWQTWWFRISSVISLVIFGFVGYKIKVRNIEKGRIYLEKLNSRLITENKERKQAENEAKVAKEKAEKSDRLKSEFLAQMSHEIRSPINTMFNFSELLKEDYDLENNPEKKEIFETIHQAGGRIIRTIDLILNMSEIQIGSYECNYVQINLNKQVLSKIFTEFLYKARKKNIELIYNPPEDDLIITADNYSLSQIFVNLVDNAIKYTPKGKIEITSYCKNNKVFVEISDTGIGIAENYLPDLFDPFTQEEQGYTRRYEGSGLGLALVKKYCEMNHAEISVESKKDAGTKFTVIFEKYTTIQE